MVRRQRSIKPTLLFTVWCHFHHNSFGWTKKTKKFKNDKLWCYHCISAQLLPWTDFILSRRKSNKTMCDFYTFGFYLSRNVFLVGKLIFFFFFKSRAFFLYSLRPMKSVSKCIQCKFSAPQNRQHDSRWKEKQSEQADRHLGTYNWKTNSSQHQAPNTWWAVEQQHPKYS